MDFVLSLIKELFEEDTPQCVCKGATSKFDVQTYICGKCREQFCSRCASSHFNSEGNLCEAPGKKCAAIECVKMVYGGRSFCNYMCRYKRTSPKIPEICQCGEKGHWNKKICRECGEFYCEMCETHRDANGLEHEAPTRKCENPGCSRRHLNRHLGYCCGDCYYAMEPWWKDNAHLN
jgi:hypothetical protein